MRDKDQVFIFNKAELALIKAVFADNDDLIYAIRKVFLQFELTKEEKKLIKGQVTPEVLAVLRKRILPEFSEHFPLTQIPDFFSTLTAEIEKRGVEDMAPMFEAKAIEEGYLLERFVCLAHVAVGKEPPVGGYDLGAMRVLKGKTPYQQYVDTTARNYLLGYIDPMLNHLKILAGAKEETPEEQEARLKRGSSE